VGPLWGNRRQERSVCDRKPIQNQPGTASRRRQSVAFTFTQKNSHKIAKVKNQDPGRAVSYKVKDDEGTLLKDTYTATDLLRIDKQRIMKSPKY
jgi:hypothetical protein